MPGFNAISLPTPLRTNLFRLERRVLYQGAFPVNADGSYNLTEFWSSGGVHWCGEIDPSWIPFLPSRALKKYVEPAAYHAKTKAKWPDSFCHLSYSLTSLKGGIQGIIYGATKGDTRSLDYGSFVLETSKWSSFLVLTPGPCNSSLLAFVSEHSKLHVQRMCFSKILKVNEILKLKCLTLDNET